jgi:hypothetical protein
MVGDAAVPVARVRIRRPDCEDRPASEGRGGVRDVRERDRAVTQPRAGADDARPHGPDNRVVPLLRRPGERGGHRDEVRVAVDARCHRAGDLDQTLVPERSHRVGHRHGQRAAVNLHVCNPRAP